MHDAVQNTLISVGVACCHSEKIQERGVLKSQLKKPGRDTMLLESGGVERGWRFGAT